MVGKGRNCLNDQQAKGLSVFRSKHLDRHLKPTGPDGTGLFEKRLSDSVVSESEDIALHLLATTFYFL